MTTFTRRDFLKAMAAASAALAVRGSGLPLFFLNTADQFNFLVIGDSIIWGQGLEEKDKFYSLTADWLREEAFGHRRDVDLKVKAHSGASIKFHPDEAEKYKKAGRDETYYYRPEVNVGFPSIWKQVEVAAEEYKAAGKSAGADLIMVTGGITDITVSTVLDPYGDNAKLPPLIQKYCRDDMYDVIELAAEKNPNAVVAVVGYFPMLSPKTPSSKLFDNWLESMSFPRLFKPFANNGLIRPLFFNRLRKKGIVRSRIWFDESNKGLQAAVDKLNAKYGRQRAIFIKSPITEDTCLETPNTLLFRMGKNGVTEDPLYRSRKVECDQALPELKKTTGIDYPVRLCEIAGVGHPNPAGARAYTESIKTALSPLLNNIPISRS